jgi:hypothetical protein
LHIFGLALLLLGHGLHALLIAAFARTENRDRSRVGVAGCARFRCRDWHELFRAGAITDTDANPHGVADPDPHADTDGDQFDAVIERDGRQPRQ